MLTSLWEKVDGNLSTLELKWKTTHRDLRFSIIMLYHFFSRSKYLHKLHNNYCPHVFSLNNAGVYVYHLACRCEQIFIIKSFFLENNFNTRCLCQRFMSLHHFYMYVLNQMSLFWLYGRNFV